MPPKTPMKNTHIIFSIRGKGTFGFLLTLPKGEIVRKLWTHFCNGTTALTN